jgi:hypothetical protein
MWSSNRTWMMFNSGSIYPILQQNALKAVHEGKCGAECTWLLQHVVSMHLGARGFPTITVASRTMANWTLGHLHALRQICAAKHANASHLDEATSSALLKAGTGLDTHARDYDGGGTSKGQGGRRRLEHSDGAPKAARAPRRPAAAAVLRPAPRQGAAATRARTAAGRRLQQLQGAAAASAAEHEQDRLLLGEHPWQDCFFGSTTGAKLSPELMAAEAVLSMLELSGQ